MQTRYMERTNSMSRGKRNLEGDDDLPDRKRPALASVIVEALKMDSLQKLCSSLEPVLRRVVSEEVERALAKLGPARVNGRDLQKATCNFTILIGQGAFGSVYKAQMLTGETVAVKVLAIDSNQGAKEFQTECTSKEGGSETMDLIDCRIKVWWPMDKKWFLM